MKKILFIIALCFSSLAIAHNYGSVVTLLNSGAVAQGAGIASPQNGISRDSYAIACTTTGTSPVSATVVVQGYNLATDTPIALATLSITGTTTGTMGVSGNGPWFYIAANQTAISASSNTVCTLGQ